MHRRRISLLGRQKDGPSSEPRAALYRLSKEILNRSLILTTPLVDTVDGQHPEAVGMNKAQQYVCPSTVLLAS